MSPRGRRFLCAALAFAAGGCVLTRSEVKALRDPDASRVDLAAIPVSITALNAVGRHCGPAGNHRRFPEELRVYEVVGKILRVRRERDRDIHIVLADPEHPRDRLVVELVDPATGSARKSKYGDGLVAAQRMFEALQARTGGRRPRDLEGRVVRVSGVGFYDVFHFQRGRSRSCLELHPVLSIDLAPGQGGASDSVPVPDLDELAIDGDGWLR